VEIRKLNNLSGYQIQPGQKLKIRGASAVTTAAPAPALAPAEADRRSSGISSTYEVASGDTVSTIAERFNMTSAELRALNNISNDRIRIGQKLRVSANQAPAKTDVASALPPPPGPESGAVEVYQAEAGDTLEMVAAFYNTTAEELRQINGLSGSQLVSGQKIKIRGAAAKPGSASGSSGSSKAGTYQVGSGDTMYSIARAHNLTVDELKKLNNKKDNNIQPGQTLKIR
jgi:LysM repeat protein